MRIAPSAEKIPFFLVFMDEDDIQVEIQVPHPTRATLPGLEGQSDFMVAHLVILLCRASIQNIVSLFLL